VRTQVAGRGCQPAALRGVIEIALIRIGFDARPIDGASHIDVQVPRSARIRESSLRSILLEVTGDVGMATLNDPGGNSESDLLMNPLHNKRLKSNVPAPCPCKKLNYTIQDRENSVYRLSNNSSYKTSTQH
jgi:hypothetical protein